MKNLGYIITLVGFLIVLFSLVLTPTHSFNPADSNSGIEASASLFFFGLIVFGAGSVVYANSVNPNRS